MSQTVKRGFQGKLYFNSGNYGSPTWVEIKNVREVKVGAAMDKEDATTRLGGGAKQYEPTLLDLNITGKIRSDQGDTTGYVALETAFLTGAGLDVMALDGDIATDGNRGVRFLSKCFKFDEDQDNAKVLYRDFELAPCVDDNPPKKVVIASAAPVFTSLAR